MKKEPLSSPKHATRKFYQEGKRLPGYSFFDFIHGYVYMRWPYFYIGMGTGEHVLAKILSPLVKLFGRFAVSPKKSIQEEDKVTFADTYHGKVVSTEAAAGLVTVEEDITLEDLEPIIPYARARDIIMEYPQHIVALECPCRSVRSDPCLPLDVCLIVGEPFASFVREHHENRSRSISQEEAIEILRAEHERGHVHHAFFKDAILDRFYAICNCCSCCCGAMEAHRNGTPMLAASGYLCHVDAALCEACGTCESVCPFEAIHIENNLFVIDEEACMGCGVCVDQCETGALRLALDPGKGEPLEIHQLMVEAAANV